MVNTHTRLLPKPIQIPKLAGNREGFIVIVGAAIAIMHGC